MEIENIYIKKIIPYEKNPRKNDKAADMVAKSIQEFGFRVPIILDKNNVIIAGHTRLKAAEKLGMTEIPCIRADNLTDEQVKAFRIMDNKSIEYADWDIDLLKEELTGLKDMNFDLELTGFSHRELDDLINLYSTENNVEISKEPKYQINRGEIWQLGNHRLMCGDATKEEDVNKLMNGKKADMVFADPPYNLGKKYNTYKDNKSYQEYKKFCLDFFKNLKIFAKHNIFITPGTQNLGLWYEIEKPKWIYCWLKMNGQSRNPLGGMQKWEPILSFNEVYWDPVLIYSNESNKKIDVIIATTDRKDKLGKEHICPKPIKLLKELIERFSKIENIILDLFLGSGTTIIAAERTRRKGYGMEIDPKYCSVIIERWENFTNKIAKKLN